MIDVNLNSGDKKKFTMYHVNPFSSITNKIKVRMDHFKNSFDSRVSIKATKYKAKAFIAIFPFF